MSYTLRLSLATHMMSTLSHLFDLPEQICYVQCGFCTTILMVSVPCSSLSMVVTVRCGHCTSLLSVNMIKASFVPFHLLTSLTHLHQQKEDSSAGEDANKSTLNIYNNNNASMMMSTYSDGEEENNNVTTPMTTIVNKPPEKRPRTPSAYNCFIKEEIRRLKAENPAMAHKEAFSTAAKNWANFPPSECRGDEESCSQSDQIVNQDSHLESHDAQVNMKKAKVCVEERFKGSIPSWDAIRTSFE